MCRPGPAFGRSGRWSETRAATSCWLETAGVAWEAANGWAPEPEYAAGRLAELRFRRSR